MPICDFADWEPLPPQQRIEGMPEKFRHEEKTQFIIHSAGGGYPGSIETWKGLGYGVYSTFFILDDGTIKQLVDSSFKANANGSANRRAISVETTSPKNTDFVGWKDKQLEALKKLIKWCQEQHPGILNRTIPSINEPGVGFHTMFGNTKNLSPWLTKDPKVCPGITRIQQFYNEIMPGLGYAPAPDEEDIVFKQRWTSDPRGRATPKPKTPTKKRGTRSTKRASLDWNTDDAFRRDTLARRDDDPFIRPRTET
jgi:hypothetical protein